MTERVDGQTILTETPEHFAKLLLVRYFVGARNQDISLRLTKMKGSPAEMQSIMRWNMEPVLRRPKGIWTNSKSPQGRDDGSLWDVLSVLGNISTW